MYAFRVRTRSVGTVSACFNSEHPPNFPPPPREHINRRYVSSGFRGSFLFAPPAPVKRRRCSVALSRYSRKRTRNVGAGDVSLKPQPLSLYCCVYGSGYHNNNNAAIIATVKRTIGGRGDRTARCGTIKKKKKNKRHRQRGWHNWSKDRQRRRRRSRPSVGERLYVCVCVCR